MANSERRGEAGWWRNLDVGRKVRTDREEISDGDTETKSPIVVPSKMIKPDCRELFL